MSVSTASSPMSGLDAIVPIVLIIAAGMAARRGVRHHVPPHGGLD